jgi:hypothetical protein
MQRFFTLRHGTVLAALALMALLPFARPAMAADAKEVKLDAAQQDAATKLRTKGATVMQIAADTDALTVNLGIIGKQATDADVALVKVLPKVQQLDLHNTGVTDAGLANIAGMTTLTQLHLNGTAITDAGLAHLKGLSNLEYLNLYNTGVTDAGVKNLDGLKKLRKLYLWQTKVTDAGAKALKSAVPEIIVNRGEELTLPPPATAPAPAKPDPKTTTKVDPAKPDPAKPAPAKPKGKAKPAAAPAAAAGGADIDDNGYIRTWLILGPIQLEGTAAEELDKNQVANEKDLKPKDGDKSKAGEKELAWKKYTSEEAEIDFNKLLAAEGKDNVAVYAVAYLDSAAEMKDLTLLMGSNDEGKLYLNGKELVKFAESRSLEKDSDKAAGVTLNKGVNVVVFKVINESNNWQGTVRFTTKDGKPVKDLKVKTAP